jgi:hypothetical protein
MIRMVMAVDTIQHFDTHAQEPGSLPFVDACLQQPTGSRVPQRMWADLASAHRSDTN